MGRCSHVHIYIYVYIDAHMHICRFPKIKALSGNLFQTHGTMHLQGGLPVWNARKQCMLDCMCGVSPKP